MAVSSTRHEHHQRRRRRRKHDRFFQAVVAWFSGPEHEHRTPSVPDYVLGDAAQKEMLQSRAAVRSHDDQVAVVRLREPADDVAGRPGVQRMTYLDA
jgi:hypothetical protein